MAAAITIEGLAKRYGEVVAVADVSFEVATGEIFGMLGSNGAGKTTTLEIVEGLRRPDAGRVELLGQPAWPRSGALLARIGVQLQRSAFFDRLTAREQLRAFARLYGAGDARVDETLAVVGLEEKADQRTDRLSGGQAQRLAIACALVHRPDVLFLDEPTAALDPQARRNLWDAIRAARDGGATVVLTTHHLEEAEALCDRVAIMDAGRVLALDAPAALVRSLDAPLRVVLDGRRVRAVDLAGLDGADAVHEDGASVVVTTTRPDAVLGALAARGVLEGLEVRGATLEDVFLELTGRAYRA